MPRFRFHDQLDELLRPDLRGRAFDWRSAENATAKHAIEALGVPHTEVGRLLVDGRVAGLGHVLREADELDVFPADASRPTPDEPPPRFLADAHLGGLARRLRLLGFDTELARDAPDRLLALLADVDERIVLSRDRELLKHRRVARGRYVRARSTDEQLREVLGHYGLRGSLRPFTRCLECNAPLRRTDRAEVSDRLPPRVAAEQREFTLCTGCRRVYWPGSHWQRLRSLVDSLCDTSRDALPAQAPTPQSPMSTPDPPARDHPPQLGRLYDDFVVGDRYAHWPGRTVIESDNSWFTLLTMNTHPLHFDAAWSATQEFGKPLVNSLLTLAIVTGMSVRETSQRAIANLGWEQVRLTAPVFVGDTLYAHSVVIAARRSRSRPGQGIVSVRTTGTNQHGTPVIEFERSFLVACRSAGAGD